MGVTVAFEFGFVGFGFIRRDLFLFEIRLGLVALVVFPGLLSAKVKKMRDELMEAAMILKGRW